MNNKWAILADFSPYRYEVDKRSHFLTKNLKIKPFEANRFWNPIAYVSVKKQYEKISI